MKIPMVDFEYLLQHAFKLGTFRPGQRDVVERLLSGKNVAAVFPTGGGKSLCYQLPSQLLSGTTVVVSPLIALMKDQCDALHRLGIAAVRLDSSMSSDQHRDAMKQLRSGEAKLMYVAPERFFNERFIASLGSLPISLLAIDEAHCISQWGHNFRPDYLKLSEIARKFAAERILALTATATPAVLKDIQSAFAIEPADAIRTPFHRPNLQLRSVVLNANEQYPYLLRQLRLRPSGSTLIYVSLQRTAEELAEQLNNDDIAARAYHAGLEPDERTAIQSQFLESDSGVVVATIAFGMGIDKANIRYVYHFNPPKSLEAYAQETGRGGRDGLPSTCELLLVPEDRVVLDNFTYGDTPASEKIERLFELLIGHRNSFYVSHYRLSVESDIRILVVRTLLTYLELDGHLLAKAPRYETYKIQPRVSSEAILRKFKADERKLIASLLSMLTKGRTYFLLNVTLASKRLGVERAAVVQRIEHLAEQGLIEVKVSDLTHGYEWAKAVNDISSLADQYAERMLRRERHEIERLDQVFELAKADGCLAAKLSAHFGESLSGGVCGQCSHCCGDGPYTMPDIRARKLGTSASGAIRAMAAKYPDALATTRDQARFLCGLTSPAMTRQRIHREPYFGVCAEVPFEHVLSFLKKEG